MGVDVKDPAVGRSRAERALGSNAKKGVKTKKKPASKGEKRRTSKGIFDGPRPSYGRYNVSEQAEDILNRSLNRRTR